MFQISPSQLVTFTTCPRKWWLAHARKLPEPPKDRKRTLGTVFHACAERWLRADDSGRTADGQPVDPFPPGWETAVERDGSRGTLSHSEQALLRGLFNDAVNAGVLRRLPQRYIESEFKIPVVPGVVMKGFIDQGNPEVIEDHKTTASRRWALGKTKLGRDAKMLCYARAHFEKHPESDRVTLRLNYVDKGRTSKPWAVEAVVTRPQVDSFWEETCQIASDMVKLGGSDGPPESKWAEVEGPRKNDACTQFGGCPYADVCGGMVTVEAFRKRHEKREGTKMGFFDKKKTAPVASAPTQPEASVTPVTPEGPEESTKGAPPWHVPSCTACRDHPGLNSKGDPCRACDVVSGRTGGKTSSQFKLWHDDQGNLCWAEPDGAAPVLEAPPAEKKPRKKREKAAPPVELESVLVELETPFDPDASTHFYDAHVRPDGFILYVSAVPLDEPFVDLAEVFAREGAELAAAQGVASVYELDAFRRRDALAAQVKEVAKTLNRKNVVVFGGASTEVKAYAELLRPLAARRIMGTF